MSVKAGQTAGPKGLTYFEGSHGYPGGNVGKLIFQKSIFLNSIFFQFHGRNDILL